MSARTEPEGGEIPIRGQELGPVLERIAAPSLATDAHGTIRWLNPAAVERVARPPLPGS